MTTVFQPEPSRDQPKVALAWREFERLLAVLRVVVSEVRVGPRAEQARLGLESLAERARWQARDCTVDETAVASSRADLLALFAQLRDPHTRLSFGGGGAARLPFDLCCRAGRYHVMTSSGAAGPPLGVRVTHWNGRPIEEVHAAMQRWIAHGGAGARARQALSLLTRRPRLAVGENFESWVELAYDADARGGDAGQARDTEPGEDLSRSWRGTWSSEERCTAQRTPRQALPGRGPVSAAQAEALTAPGHGSAGDADWGGLLAWGEVWTLHRLVPGSQALLLRLGEVPSLAEVETLRAALRREYERRADAAIAPLVLDLRGNPGGCVEAALALHRMLVPHASPARLLFQFANTALMRRLLSQHPRWRAWATPADDDYLAARPMEPAASSLRGGLGQERQPPWCGARCVAVLVDDATFSAAEILGHLLQQDGVSVLGDVASTSGGTANAWAYPALQSLAPSARAELPHGHDGAVRREVLGALVSRYFSRRATVHEIEPGRRWWVTAPGAAAREDCEPGGIGSVGALVEIARDEHFVGVANPDALLLFDRNRPVLPELPFGAGLQCGVRRAVLASKGGLRALGPLVVDERVPRGAAQCRDALPRWLARRLGLGAVETSKLNSAERAAAGVCSESSAPLPGRPLAAPESEASTFSPVVAGESSRQEADLSPPASTH